MQCAVGRAARKWDSICSAHDELHVAQFCIERNRRLVQSGHRPCQGGKYPGIVRVEIVGCMHGIGTVKTDTPHFSRRAEIFSTRAFELSNEL